MKLFALLLIAALCAAHEVDTLHYLFETIKGGDVEPTSVPVKGVIPSWLKFDRYNNGFGRFEGNTSTGEQWSFNFLFDVMSYVQFWKVADGKVSYAHKFVQSKYYNESFTEIPPYRTFGGTDPDMGEGEKIKALTNMLSDNYNVNIVQIGGKLLTISDMAGQMEIDASDLSTIGNFHFPDQIDKEFTALITCAHPSQLPGDKYVYNYQAMMFGNFPHLLKVQKYQLYRIDTTKSPLVREVVLQIPTDAFGYMHQFAHTPNYIIFFEYPLMWELLGIAKSTKILPNMKWKPERGTKVQVIDKRTWKVVQNYTTDTFFAYHHLNAYEEGDNVIVDIMTTQCNNTEGPAECNHMNTFNLATLKKDGYNIPKGPLRRFTVPVKKTGPITYYDVNGIGMDLYAIHPSLKGAKHRYVWSLGNVGDRVWWNSVVKVDMETNETLTWYQEDHYPSEVSFFPRPGATEEDDGILATTVLGADVKTSYLLLLDAKTMKQVAVAPGPAMLPFPSHGHSCAAIGGEDMCWWG